MSNFSSEIRREILSMPNTREEMLSELRALLLTSGECGKEKLSFTCEDERVAELFFGLMERAFGVTMQLAGTAPDPRRNKDKLTFGYAGADVPAIAAEIFAARGGINCKTAFLRGAFLGGGSCTLPREGARTGYHLEFVFPHEAEAAEFLELLDDLQLFGNIVKRGERAVVYCKSREAIGDFLSVLQAQGALRMLTAVSEVRAESNNENRVENCIAGNADKAAIASAAQTLAIGELERAGILIGLSEPLREVAQARMHAPELSMGELAQKIGISKSCLAHRLRKLMRIYEENIGKTPKERES